MTTPERTAEASEASIAFQIALAQIGVATIEEAMDLWRSVNPADVAGTSARWLERATSLILSRRRMSRDLAFAYYRLARALHTGTTIADPYNPLKQNPTLDDVRREFASMVEDVANVTTDEQAAQADQLVNRDVIDVEAQVADDESAAPDTEADDELDRLIVEELERLREDEEAIERAIEDEIRIDLEALGPKGLQKRLDEIKVTDDTKAQAADSARAEAHRKSGARQAAAAERIVLDGGRGALYHYSQKDKRALAWARVSSTGTPCGWCAMLISRGAVYKSRNAAQFSDGDLYHDNCHCYAEPVFTEDQYDNDPRFDLNREYAALWPVVTEGYGGKDAVSVWRKYIREQKAQKSSKTYVRQTINPTVQAT